MPVREMLERIDSRELSEWMAFHNLEPFGDEWRRSGLTTAAIYNVNRTKGRAFKPDEFMPIARRAVKQGRKAIVNAFRAIAGRPAKQAERESLPDVRRRGRL